MSTTYAAVGQCIYCGAKEYAPGSSRKLAEEHIIPLAIGGTMVLPAASCQLCERLTGRVESIALNNHLIGPRRYLGLKGRTPAHKGPKELPVFVPRNGMDEKVMVAVEDHPSALFLLHLHNPPVFRDLLGQPDVGPTGMFTKWFNYQRDLLLEKYGIEEWSTTSLDLWIFARMLAKIGHSYAVAKLGLHGFEPLLRDAIQDPSRDSAAAMPFVGGMPEEAPEEALHTIMEGTTEIAGTTFHVVRVRLFAQFGAPTYVVVVGTKLGETPPPLLSSPAGVDASRSVCRLRVPVQSDPPKPNR